MRYNPEIHNRRTIRLNNYDYSSEGLYFVTVCTEEREQILGDVVNANIKLSEYGKIANEEWIKLENRFRYIRLHECVIMPNHVHAIIEILDGNKSTLGKIIRIYKSICSKRCNQIHNVNEMTIWQRNYYEHIIRNEKELYNVIQYIKYNPLNWGKDKYNKTTRAWLVNANGYSSLRRPYILHYLKFINNSNCLKSMYALKLLRFMQFL